jgi:O-antigen ligase
MASIRTTPAFNPIFDLDRQDVTFSWGKVFLILFAFVIIGRIQEGIPALWPYHIGLVTGGLAGIVWYFSLGSLHDKIPTQIPQVRYVIWLLVLSVLTVPIGVWPGNSFDYVTGVYWKVILFYLMVLFWSRSIKDIEAIVWACCLGLSAQILFGLAFVGDVDRFKAGSGTYDANDLALVLVMALPLLVHLFSIAGRGMKLVVSAMIFICLYGVVLTQSRGGFLALVAAGILIIFRSRIGTAGRIGIIVVGLVVFGMLAGVQYWDRMSTIWSPQTEYDQTAGGRTELWKNGLKILVTHPWGVGIENYSIADGLSRGVGGPGSWMTAHNSFLQLGVELGVAGLIVFSLLITGAIRDLRRIQAVPKKETDRKIYPSNALHQTIKVKSPVQEKLLPLAVALETSLWSFVIGGFFLSQAYSPVLYCVLALSLACKRMMQETTTAMTDETIIKMHQAVKR